MSSSIPIKDIPLISSRVELRAFGCSLVAVLLKMDAELLFRQDRAADFFKALVTPHAYLHNLEHVKDWSSVIERLAMLTGELLDISVVNTDQSVTLRLA